MLFTSSMEAAVAYPIFAQQNYANPRDTEHALGPISKAFKGGTWPVFEGKSFENHQNIIIFHSFSMDFIGFSWTTGKQWVSITSIQGLRGPRTAGVQRKDRVCELPPGLEAHRGEVATGRAAGHHLQATRPRKPCKIPRTPLKSGKIHQNRLKIH